MYKIKILLEDSKPPIWRRVLVPNSYTLAQLHDIIQITMGWTDSHLHAFHIDKKIYEKPNPAIESYDCDNTYDASKFPIRKLQKGQKYHYCYDFGDNWDHIIEIEDTLSDKNTMHPTCLKITNACPPEDCGGVWGYYKNLEILKDKKHPEYQDTKEWMGNFYNEKMSLAEVNKELKILAKTGKNPNSLWSQ